MKSCNTLKAIIFFFAFALTATPAANAQILKKLGKKAQNAAERTVEQRVEEETTKKTDQALDSILNPGAEDNKNPSESGKPETGGSDGSGDAKGEDSETPSTGPKTLEVYSKFDFVPGDKTLFFDDFAGEFVGDLPLKWNTNGGGEVVTLGDSPGQWYAVTNKSLTVPNFTGPLPEDFTVEFDVKAVNISRKTSSAASLTIYLSETPNLNTRENFVAAEINFCQYIAMGIQVYNQFEGNPDPIRNTLGRDLREVYQDVVHVSIAANKNRFRIWLNEAKIADIPMLIRDPSKINYFKMAVNGFDEQTKGERLLITNIKVAEGGVDLRRKLLSEGMISTNGILFDSGSDKIKPESMGIIRQIYQVLQRDASIELNIVGHTDSDGSDDSNLKLSKQRAEAVKNALTTVYGAEGNRLTTEGKGESEPVAENNTPEGKAQNRRVVFVKK